jgi:hypothetical protein
MNESSDIEIEEGGEIGVFYLKKIWSYYQHFLQPNIEAEEIEWKYINGVFNTLGLGIEPTIRYLTQESPSFDHFQVWIKENGKVVPEVISHYNSIVGYKASKCFKIEEKVLSEADLESWKQNGYIILKNAVSKADCSKAENLIYNTIEASPSDPDSWYKSHSLKQGIMIQLFDAPILNKIRMSKRIRSAYEQLWNRGDLMVSMDRVSFNPPERDSYQFPGPNLHWDVSLKKPIPFGLQGLLYLADTDKDQGAFTVIRGFHNKIDVWLDHLPEGVHPREQDLKHDFELDPISAKAGDFIIWDQRLPHGSSPNYSSKPRLVQYINYQPLDLEYQKEWI